jgi:hypothetical protein
MEPERAISLLIDRFPVLRQRVDDPGDLLIGPHFAYSLLATEALDRHTDEAFLDSVVEFINDLATSGDSLLEEVLVVDILEGIAQDPNLSNRIKANMSPKALYWLERVETEYFGRKT